MIATSQSSHPTDSQTVDVPTPQQEPESAMCIEEQPQKPSETTSNTTALGLLMKRRRWKPKGSELQFLKNWYEKSHYPTREEKDSIIKEIARRFSAKRSILQINRWFQHYREKQNKESGAASRRKNGYSKFPREAQEFLKTAFDTNPYPSYDEMQELANRFNVPLSKIENWYKHYRRALAKRGNFNLKNRKYFKTSELSYLEKNFSITPKPSKDKYEEIADFLKCDVMHIKNWFSNKRKKQKKMFHASLQKLSRDNHTTGIVGHEELRGDQQDYVKSLISQLRTLHNSNKPEGNVGIPGGIAPHGNGMTMTDYHRIVNTSISNITHNNIYMNNNVNSSDSQVVFKMYASGAPNGGLQITTGMKGEQPQTAPKMAGSNFSFHNINANTRPQQPMITFQHHEALNSGKPAEPLNNSQQATLPRTLTPPFSLPQWSGSHLANQQHQQAQHLPSALKIFGESFDSTSNFVQPTGHIQASGFTMNQACTLGQNRPLPGAHTAQMSPFSLNTNNTMPNCFQFPLQPQLQQNKSVETPSNSNTSGYMPPNFMGGILPFAKGGYPFPQLNGVSRSNSMSTGGPGSTPFMSELSPANAFTNFNAQASALNFTLSMRNQQNAATNGQNQPSAKQGGSPLTSPKGFAAPCKVVAAAGAH